MKAGKIITLGLVATSAGLIMGTVELPAQAALWTVWPTYD
jgi:hypothetical protein